MKAPVWEPDIIELYCIPIDEFWGGPLQLEARPPEFRIQARDRVQRILEEMVASPCRKINPQAGYKFRFGKTVGKSNSPPPKLSPHATGSLSGMGGNARRLRFIMM